MPSGPVKRRKQHKNGGLFGLLGTQNGPLGLLGLPPNPFQISFREFLTKNFHNIIRGQGRCQQKSFFRLWEGGGQEC